MGIFLVEGYVKTVPVSLEEAAAIDGSSFSYTLWTHHFPDLQTDPRDRSNHSGIQLLE
ncbi:MAG: hypothetical protein ACLR2E_16610 [Lachnospiraceae bacterium]